MNSSFLFKIAFAVLISIPTFAASPYGRLIVIGDSLSDMGTYEKMAKPFGGGKFTTNPGKIWIEIIAENYGLPLAVNRHEGLGSPEIVGGFNYAQGGARVSSSEVNQDDRKFSARSLTTQLGYFLTTHKNFKPDDLIFLFGGPNDIFSYIRNATMKPETALEKTAQTANELVGMVAKMNAHGAKNVVVINLPAIDATPMALGLSVEKRNLVKQMVQVFNDVLATKAIEHNYKLVDLHTFDVLFNETHQLFGFKNITSPACKMNSLAIKSAVVCAKKHLVEPNANETYKFADTIHPTTGYGKAAAAYIWSQLN